MQNQIPLFDTEEHQHQPQRMKKSRTKPALRGTIQRGLEQLKDSDNWIKRISKLKFKRLEAQHGDL